MVYFLIIILSLINNWGVQLAYYYYRVRKDKYAFRGQKTLLQYYTGYIGDGLIAPVINILIYYSIVNTGYSLVLSDLVWCYVGGLTLDIVVHYIQGRYALTNWSMPYPFRWNFAGFWHMISFPIQIGYLLLFGKVFATYGAEAWCLISIAGLMILFVVLYCIDNDWLKLRKSLHSTP